MATPVTNVTPDTLITLKVSLNDALKRLKLPLKDLNAFVLPVKIRQCLNIPADQIVAFERYSDSAGGFIGLDATSIPAYKALVRAAKAKGKLRIKASIVQPNTQQQEQGNSSASAYSSLSRAVPPPPPPPAASQVAEGLDQLNHQMEDLTTKLRLAELNSALDWSLGVRKAQNSSSTVPALKLNTDRVYNTLPPYSDTVTHPSTVQPGQAMLAPPMSHPSLIASAVAKAASNAAPAVTPQPPVIPRASMVAQPAVPAQPSAATQPSALAFRTRQVAPPQPSPAQPAWSVYCNACDDVMANAHYHCGICDNGDYDLCEKCVSNGKLCPGPDHWLIKRFIQDGKVVSSVTERVGRKVQSQDKQAEESKTVEKKIEMPGSFGVEDNKVLAQETQLEQPPARTCNNCVVVLPEREFVNCNVCTDFDLCISCHVSNTHGHHPAHDFSPASSDRVLPMLAQNLLKSGRNVMHNAFCDGCNKKIFGVRHKCLNCPDWDYCSTCVLNAGTAHPTHRFAAIYEQLLEPQPNYARHFGVYCDGPLCNGKPHQSYIEGVRYKCAVCHDTDFCSTCEAHPNSTHNRTHPLIKFSTPVRNVNVQTINSNHGLDQTMGDKPVPVVKTENVETAVQTVADFAPSDVKPITRAGQPKDGDFSSPPRLNVSVDQLSAVFVRDSVQDGTVIAPGARFTQVWTLRNDGRSAWPVGCSVRFVGGDNMLNVDNASPASVASIAEATESSVVGREVQRGELISFKVTLKAPLRQGKSISYWRLKAPDGTPFGHRLWCDIDVRRQQVLPQSAITYDNSPRTILANARSRQEAVAASSSKQGLPRTIPYHQIPVHTSNLCSRRAVPSMRSCDIAEPFWPNSTFNTSTFNTSAFNTPAQSAAQGAAQSTTQIAAQSTTQIAPLSSVFDRKEQRKEEARARVDQIREKILRYRADHLKAHAEMKDSVVGNSADAEKAVAKDVAVSVPEVKEEPAVDAVSTPQIKQEPAVDATSEGIASTSSSQMVFPKLDKESPASSIIASSTHAKAATVETEEGEVENSAVATTANEEEFEEDSHTVTSPVDEDFDDLEVLSISGVSEDEDDGFLTDEEYDILDASDRETVASP